ncbi:hypothetical protein E2C01_065388 [Portunus trituberculatus]|uniref:Uncharacterized protein n=1 Tax=Portunus trituberculatus TaxID=210409 RepID=A0A5B7HN13_PORTR|nr:hypothetical protein [Portunus trituberculatus]
MQLIFRCFASARAANGPRTGRRVERVYACLVNADECCTALPQVCKEQSSLRASEEVLQLQTKHDSS